MQAAHMLSADMKGNSKYSGAQQSCHLYQCGLQSTVFEGAVPPLLLWGDSCWALKNSGLGMWT